jgi:hypothetical protein
MTTRMVLLTVLAVLLVATAAEAMTLGEGARDKTRAYFQHIFFVQNITNDKATVYEEYGYPIHRLRVYAYGAITEHWTYYADGVEFVFDQNDRLIRTERFWPENKRARFEEFPGY